MDESDTNPGGEEGTDEAQNRFGRAREFMGDKYAAASDAVRDKYNSVREKVDDVDFGELLNQVRNYVKSNPGKALLISVGAGFLIGLLLRRDDSDSED
jgi:ElaB/YqjD/DUF883 family membrane-anchored ribosome-binding protein